MPGAVNGVISESDSTGTNFGQQIPVVGIRVWSKMVSRNGVFMFKDHPGSNRFSGDFAGSVQTDYAYNVNGQRVVEWNAANGTVLKGHYYWGGKPVAFYTKASNGVAATHFQHQDWLGTERMRTAYSYTGSSSIEGTYTSLPWGDSQVPTGTDADANHYASLDHDTESNTDHAQFRQYSNASGSWMSPDPYSGSYDPTNPQSFNRFAYVGNNPLSMVDSAGLKECQNVPCGGGDGGSGCNPNDLFCDPGGCDPLFYDCWGDGGGGDGGGLEGPIGTPQPEFKGYEDLDPTRVMNDHLGLPAGMRLPTGSILDIFGVGNPGCEFGACDGGPMGLEPGQSQGGSSYQPLPSLQLPIGPILSSVRSTPGPPKPKKYSGWDWWSRYGSQIICELSSTATGDNPELFLGGTITGSGLLVYGPTWKVKAAGVPFILATWGKAADIRSQCVSGIWGPGYH